MTRLLARKQMLFPVFKILKIRFYSKIAVENADIVDKISLGKASSFRDNKEDAEELI